MLPHKTTQARVAAVEKLLLSLWRTRNALHHGVEPATRPRRPENHCRKFATPRSNANRGKLGITDDKLARPCAPQNGSPCQLGAIHTAVSNANHSSVLANGPLTRNRARLLRQHAEAQAGRPSQLGPTPAKAKSTHSPAPCAQVNRRSRHPTVPCAQTNRHSRRLESMESISKTY